MARREGYWRMRSVLTLQVNVIGAETSIFFEPVPNAQPRPASRPRRSRAPDGHGVLMRSEWDVAPYLARGRLRRVLRAWALPAANVTLVYPI